VDNLSQERDAQYLVLRIAVVCRPCEVMEVTSSTLLPLAVDIPTASDNRLTASGSVISLCPMWVII
jgi:hypothetical protein